MTATNATGPTAQFPLLLAESGTRVSVVETWWGYIVQTEQVMRSTRQIICAGATFLAIGFAVASAAIWFAPAMAFTGDVMTLKAMVSCMLALSALLLTFFAEDPPVVEIHVDSRKGEMRHILRKPSGATRQLGAYRFEDIGDIYFDGQAEERLVARCGAAQRLVTIAPGRGPIQDRIFSRIGRDIAGFLRAA